MIGVSLVTSHEIGDEIYFIVMHNLVGVIVPTPRDNDATKSDELVSTLSRFSFMLLYNFHPPLSLSTISPIHTALCGGVEICIRSNMGPLKIRGDFLCCCILLGTF